MIDYFGNIKIQCRHYYNASEYFIKNGILPREFNPNTNTNFVISSVLNNIKRQTKRQQQQQQQTEQHHDSNRNQSEEQTVTTQSIMIARSKMPACNIHQQQQQHNQRLQYWHCSHWLQSTSLHSGNTQLKRQPDVFSYSVQAEVLIGSTRYSRNWRHNHYLILNKSSETWLMSDSRGTVGDAIVSRGILERIGDTVNTQSILYAIDTQ